MTESKDDDAINYELLVEDSLRTVVRSALALVAHEGLPGDAHFYISFNTSHPDVDISDSLRNAHKDEMTIVLQHQFWDLAVTEHNFSVGLSFSGVQHRLKIPFSAITHFTDPSVGFGLQFSGAEDAEGADDGSSDGTADTNTPTVVEAGSKPASDDNAAEKNNTAPDIMDTDTADTTDSAKVVSLDHFRKNSDAES